MFVQLTYLTLKYMHSFHRTHGTRYNVCRSPQINLLMLPVMDLNILTHFLKLCITRMSLEEGFQMRSILKVLWSFFPYSEKIKDIKCSRMFKSFNFCNTVVKVFVNINRCFSIPVIREPKQPELELDTLANTKEDFPF